MEIKLLILLFSILISAFIFWIVFQIKSCKCTLLWSRNKPNGKAKIICAKLIGFGIGEHTYEVLYWNERKNLWYNCSGEEIPYGMIDEWIVIER